MRSELMKLPKPASEHPQGRTAYIIMSIPVIPITESLSLAGIGGSHSEFPPLLSKNNVGVNFNQFKSNNNY